MSTIFNNLAIEMSDTDMWKETMFSLIGINPAKSWADQMEEDEEHSNPKPIVTTLDDIKGWEFPKKKTLRSECSDTNTESTTSTCSSTCIGKIVHYTHAKKYGILIPNAKIFNQEQLVFFGMPRGASNGTRVKFWVEKTDKGAGFLAHIVDVI